MARKQRAPVRRADVVRILSEQRRDLQDRFGVLSLTLFGSVARDEARHDSDIDLLVEFRHPVGLFHFIGLQQELERLLGCKVDLGTPRSLKPRIKDRVLQETVRVA